MSKYKEKKIRVWTKPKKSSKSAKFFDSFDKSLLLDDEIGKKAIRLLLYISSNLNYDEDTIYLSPSEIAKELNTTDRTVRLWKKILIDKKIILKTERRNWYKVNLKCIYKGTVRQKVKNRGKGHTGKTKLREVKDE